MLQTNSAFKACILCLILLTEQFCCHPRGTMNLKITESSEVVGNSAPRLQDDIFNSLLVLDTSSSSSSVIEKRTRLDSARKASLSISKPLSALKISQANQFISCGELLDQTLVGAVGSLPIAGDLIRIALAVALGGLACQQEAETFIIQLYRGLGIEDTNSVLSEVKVLMAKNLQAKPVVPGDHLDEHKFDVLMFNIEQIASHLLGLGDHTVSPKHCRDLVQVNGSLLLGSTYSVHTQFAKAEKECQTLGFFCAGVTYNENSSYSVIRRLHSYFLPRNGAQSWLHQCDGSHVEESRHHVKRSALIDNCTSEGEQRAYKVLNWIPVVSTFYNLGSAVYYATVNCSDIATERAIYTAIDLGTDALIAVTGGMAGFAGMGLSAGLKVGAKVGVNSLLNYLKQESPLVSQ